MLSDFILFLKKPNYISAEKYKLVSFFKETLTLLFFILLVKMVFSIIQVIVLNPHKLPIIDKKSLLEIIFYSLILGPIIEELAFRLPLIFNKRNFCISSFFLTYSITALIFKNYYLGIVLGLIIFIFFQLLFNELKLNLLRKWFTRNYKIIFYIYIILFGYMHLFSYDISLGETWIYSPLICFPHIISGFIYSYMRIKYNIWASILLHFLFNSILFFLGKIF